MHATLFLCCILAMLPEDAAEEDQAAEAIALEQRALNARRAIVRGEVEYHFARRFRSEEMEQKYEWRTVFDGERIRCDVKPPAAFTSDTAGPARAMVARRCVFTKDSFLRYFHVNTPGGDTHVLYAYQSDRPYPLWLATEKIDPRLIGVVPADPLVLHGASLDTFLALPDRTNTSVERRELEGLQTWRVQYDRRDGARIRIWIAPSQGYSVVRAAAESRYDVGSVLQTIECENREYGNPGVWFPRQVRYERFMNEKWYYGVVLTVGRARFNHAVDEKVFGLAGMDIPEGTTVIDLSGPCKSPAVWDGRNVAPLGENPPLGDLEGEGSGAGVVTWSLMMSPAALALAALLACFVRWRPRIEKSRPGD